MRILVQLLQVTNMVAISQSVAILIDGNNIEKSIHGLVGQTNVMLNFDVLVPALVTNRSLNRIIYFREGVNISAKLAERLRDKYHGSVIPCHKSADIPLTIYAIQICEKVDTIIILSGDSDYIELVRHLKSKGVRVEVCSVLETTAQVLKDECDHHIPLSAEHIFSYVNPKAKAKKKKKGNVPVAGPKKVG